MQKVVVITGCSSGLGFAMANRFLEGGWRVIATLRGVEKRKEIFQKHENLTLLELDVTKGKDRGEVASYLKENCGGRLDCLINNAAYTLVGPLEDLPEEAIREQMETNFFGLALTTKQLMPHLREAKGRVINISSVFGFTPFPLFSMYCASKFAVEGLCETLRYEMAPHGVQVALVHPAGHKTRLLKNAELFLTSSVYKTQIENYERISKKLREKEGGEPKDFAEKVFGLTNKKKMPHSLLVGSDARLLSYAKRFLPRFIYNLLFCKINRK